MKEGALLPILQKWKGLYKRIPWKLYEKKLHKLDEIDKLEAHNLPRLNHKEIFKNLNRPKRLNH